MLTYIKKTLNGLMLSIACLTSTAVLADDKPNIIIILLDDLGYADVGFMEHAEPDIYTPNLDELANNGVVFTSSYATHAYCGPSRAGLMTGRYQHEFGAHFNHASYEAGGVDLSETFFSKVLQDAGYNTGLIGKWHLGEEPDYQPNQRGFDYFYGMLGGGHVYHTKDFVRVADFNPENPGWSYHNPLMENKRFASEVGYEKNLYITDMFTDAGVDFIKRADGNDEQPFFLMMSYNAPHTPEEAKASDIKELRDILGDKASSNAKRHTYSAMVYAVDRGVKKIVETLKETGEFDNTLIVFFSDNGGRLNNASARNTPLRSGKTSNYEGGVRVPMFIHWPKGRLPQGRYKHAVSTLDLYPTLINLAGVKAPSDKLLDGKEILDDIRAGRNTRENDPLYFMMHLPKKRGGLNQTAAVLNNWKWFTTGNGKWQLFDLSKDIAEQKPVRNTSAQKPILDKLYQWTWEHTQPAFFDSPSYGWEAAWNKHNMPNFSKTFPKRFNQKDYVKTPLDVNDN